MYDSYAFPAPSLSSWSGFWLAGLVSTVYVLSVYVSQLIAHPRPPLWRNEPTVIKARSFMAILSTMSSCAIVYVVIRSKVDEKSVAINPTLQHLGFPIGPLLPSIGFFKAFLVVPLLFLGPLYATFLDGMLPFQRNWRLREDFILRISTWEGFRNYIMAPITEEVTYRACVLSVFHLAGFTRKTMIWLAPCWFGLAHLHHAYETYKRLGRSPQALRTATLSSLFQFVYTTVFGWLCSFLFLRSGSIAVPVVAHIFCNVMGFPAITSELKEHPSRKTSIILVYLLGVVLFFYTLNPWTSNPDSLYWTSKAAVQNPSH